MAQQSGLARSRLAGDEHIGSSIQRGKGANKVSIDLNELPPEGQERARVLLATGDWEEVEPDPEGDDQESPVSV